MTYNYLYFIGVNYFSVIELFAKIQHILFIINFIIL